MSTHTEQMSAPVEMPPTRPEKDEPVYSCAYCEQERGRDFMDQMCADCFWDYESLRKRPGKISWSLLHDKYHSPEEQDRVKRWIREAEKELAEFEEKLEAGQDRIHRELEIHEVYGVMGFGASNPYREADDEQFKEVWALNAAYDAAHPIGAGAGGLPKSKPKTLQEMTVDEINQELFDLDDERRELRRYARGREMTPEESEDYANLDRAAQARVDELLRRRE
jgi:hypothetical protein